MFEVKQNLFTSKHINYQRNTLSKIQPITNKTQGNLHLMTPLELIEGNAEKGLQGRKLKENWAIIQQARIC